MKYIDYCYLVPVFLLDNLDLIYLVINWKIRSALMRFQHVHCSPPVVFFLCHIVQVLTPDSWRKSSLQTSEIQPPYWSFHFESSKSLFTSLSLVSCWTNLSWELLDYLKKEALNKFNSLPFKVQLTLAWVFVLHYNRIFQVPLMQSDLKVFQACHCALRGIRAQGIDLDILFRAPCFDDGVGIIHRSWKRDHKKKLWVVAKGFYVLLHVLLLWLC